MARILMTTPLRVLLAATALLGLAPPAQAEGAKVFKAQCAACHATTSGAPAGVGPRLNRVVGRRAGTMPGYAFSAAMKGSGLVWSAAELKRYLAEPAKTVKGNKMPYAGLKNAQQLDEVVAYLATLH